MSDRAEDFLTAPIDDYLLALADGITRAQKQLSQVAIELQPGQPAITYQLPKVEFEFRMSFELGTESTTASSTTEEGSRKVLRVRPADAAGSTTERSRAQAASLIKGSFIAVPALGGQPPPVVRTTTVKRPGRQYEINVYTHTPVGVGLAGVEVQFNVDWELSNRLNSAHEWPSVDQASGYVTLERGVVTTNDLGHAVNVVRVSGEEGAPAAVFVAVIVDVLGKTETLTFQF